MAGARRFRVLLKGGWAIGVEADSHHNEKRSASLSQAEMNIVSFTKGDVEVCAVPLAELVAIADDAAVWQEPYRVDDMVTASPAALVRSRAAASNGNGRKKRSRR